MTLLDLMVRDDDHPAIVAPHHPPLSYRQLRQTILTLLDQLHHFGLGQGDRISIVMPNGPEMVITFLAAALCGTAAPLNPKYKPEEFAFYYQDTNAKALITLPGMADPALAAASPEMMLLNAIAQPDGSLTLDRVQPGELGRNSTPMAPQPDDIALILHTSGTTSRPKRVPIRHRNLTASARNIIGTYDLNEQDVSLCVMPLFHIHGIVASTLAALGSGGTVVCPTGGFNALEFWALLREFKPTWFSAVPTMYQMLLSRAERNQDVIQATPLRFMRSSSASLPPIILERLEAVFEAPVLEAYSMTEAAHQMTSNPIPPQAHKPGSVGYGHGVEVAIMDEEGRLLDPGERGEVVVKGANVFDGYENNPEANAKAFSEGWFRTGDQGMVDPDGYVIITGRLKELINRGGEKISPLEVDDVLLRHPVIAEAIAFSVPHKTLGEDIHAAVVLKADQSISESDLKAHCASFLAEFKIPRQFHILTELPRGATGKLQRLQMARLLQLTGES